jgi:DNA modification methylase
LSTTKLSKIKFKEIEFDLDSFKNKGYLTHNFHSFPAKFVPQIPRIVIEKLSIPGSVVMDPFCGSGTTLVEAKLTGRHSIGIDINPISLVVSKAKTTIITNSQFLKIDKILEKIQKDFKEYEIKNSEKYITIPVIYNLDLWFQKNVQIELGIIKKNVDAEKNTNIRNFLLTGFSAIINQVSNQISDTKYASIDKNIQTNDTINKFVTKILGMKQRLIEFSKLAQDVSCKIHNCSTLSIKPVNDEQVDLMVTSPPYANTYDYYLYHRHRMEWLECYSKQTQSLEIGSRNKHSDDNLGIQSYLDSMEESMKEFHRVLKDNSFLCMVIGDSIKDKKLIKMDTEFMKLGKNIGFKTKQCFSYDIGKYSTYFRWAEKVPDKKGHIIIFQK